MSKVCVVGAGISGISTAYFLNKQGYDVTVIDGKRDIAQGATAVAPPLLPIASENIVGFNIYRKVQSNYCPVKFLKGETHIGDQYAISTFTNAFGPSFLKNFFPSTYVPATQKLCRLSATNHALVLSLVRDLKLNVPFNFGFLRIGDDRGKMKEMVAHHTLVSDIVENYDALRLEGGDVSRMFPPAQNKNFDLHGGIFEPSTAVMSPVELTRELARVCKERGVEFVMDTQVRALKLDESGEKVTHLETNKGNIPVDNVVLCSGYSSFALTDALVPGGALVPLIPVRSLAVSIDDSTPNVKPMPTLFPTKPLTMMPAIIDKPEDYEKAPEPSTIVAAATLASGEKLPFHPAAVEFSKVNVVIASDATNPRRAKAYSGRDMADLSDDMPEHHYRPMLNLLDVVRRVPKGAYIDTTISEDYHNKRPQDGQILSTRRFNVVPELMALHTVARDGLPLMGQAPVVKNLFFNTGHGPNPLATAVAGGQVAAAVVHDVVSGGKSSVDGSALTNDLSVLNVDDYSPQRFEVKPMHVGWFRKQK